MHTSRQSGCKGDSPAPTHAIADDLLREFLDHKAELYENPQFISSDPIQIPHRFTEKQDIEIAAFLSATIAWGQRKAIIKSATRMMALLGNAPYEFIKNHRTKDLEALTPFVHRTFNAGDFKFFISRLQRLYEGSDTLETHFLPQAGALDLKCAISRFRSRFFGAAQAHHAAKHLSNPLKNSAAKRLNLFLRWMVRSPAAGVDFGLWKGIQARQLCIPLDVHSGRIARKLGLLKRKQNDWKAVEALNGQLRTLDPADPVKYDFALFGLGAFEKF